MGRITVEYKDFDGDRIQSSLATASANSDGSDYDTLLSAAEALRDAINDITIGGLSLFAYEAAYTASNPNVATPLAQTNVQWVVQYTDDVNGRVFTKRIGTADLTVGVKSGNETIVDLAGTEGSALVTAFENAVLSEDGNPVTVNKIYFRQ